MKKTLLTLTVAFIASFANAQVKIYDFPFDNSYSATVGTGTFASNSGTSFTTDRHGNPNGAIRIDGTGTTATLTGLPYGNSARTISFWMKLNTIRGDYNFLYNYGTAAAAEGVYVKPSNVIAYAPAHSSALVHNINVWYHFAFTYDGTSSKIYRNGVLVSTLAISKNTVNNVDAFTLGLTENGWTDYFDGAIDDLQIYDYALSSTEIGNLLTVGIKDIVVTNNAITVFPNPTKDQINLNVQTNLQLTNATGQIIADKKNVNTLDLSDQPTGIYFLTLTNNNGQVIQRSKIVKE